MRLNGALFYNDYTGVTATFGDCTEQFGPVFGVPCLLNSNAGDAKVKGAELELDVIPIDGLQIDGSFSVLDFEYKRVNPATGIGLDAITQYTPEMTWSIGAQYAYETGFGVITPRLDVSYQDDMFTTPDNAPGGKVDAYTLLNGRITFEDPENDWVLALEVRNLTDKLYYTTKGEGVTGGSGFDNGSPGLPRTWMVSVRRNF
jgi:iron complex outermembrane receptor protein